MPARSAISVILLLGIFYKHTRRKTILGVKITTLIKLKTYSASVPLYI
jgi:hypothetical protein